MAKQEPVPTKQEKAFERVKNFRAELVEYREQLERVKKEQDASVCPFPKHPCSPCPVAKNIEQQASQNRSELLGRRPHQTATPENPYANNVQYAAQQSAIRPANPSAFGASPADYTRETHAMREQSFMSSTNAQLDEFLDRGRAVLGDLGNQRDILKGTQRKLYGVANTLGISGDTIRMVERRAKQDKWIFWAGVIVFFGFCYLVLRWLR
jgi:Golgi SNAP receptor complex protein 2